jgi:hypothetical protein
VIRHGRQEPVVVLRFARQVGRAKDRGAQVAPDGLQCVFAAMGLSGADKGCWRGGRKSSRSRKKTSSMQIRHGDSSK